MVRSHQLAGGTVAEPRLQSGRVDQVREDEAQQAGARIGAGHERSLPDRSIPVRRYSTSTFGSPKPWSLHIAR